MIKKRKETKCPVGRPKKAKQNPKGGIKRRGRPKGSLKKIWMVKAAIEAAQPMEKEEEPKQQLPERKEGLRKRGMIRKPKR